MIAQTARPEFSRLFRVDRLGAAPAAETIEADSSERASVARRLGLVGIHHLAASLVIRRELGADIIRVDGRLEADIVQTCVVTLEPFPSHVEDNIQAAFCESVEEPADIIDVDPEDDPPEPILDGVLDLGELATQFLSLALDPYPRSPGAALESGWVEGADPASPFAVLESLKTRN